MQTRRFMWLMVLPTLIVFLLIGVYPTIQAVISSFTSYNMTSLEPKTFVGFSNYIRMFTESRFWMALARTLGFVALDVLLSFSFGLFVAILLNKINKVRNFYRIVFLIPMIVAPTVTALNFKFMYNYNFGIFNHILNWLKVENIDFLGNPSVSIFSCLAVDVWMGTPLVILVLLAGLESQSPSLYEAAMLDGANSWQIFREITMPLLKRYSIIVVMLRSMDSMKVYEVIHLMTTGGPGTSSETLNIYISKVGFSWFEMGYASALGIFILYFIMFIMKLLLSKIRVFQDEERKIVL